MSQSLCTRPICWQSCIQHFISRRKRIIQNVHISTLNYVVLNGKATEHACVHTVRVSFGLFISRWHCQCDGFFVLIIGFYCCCYCCCRHFYLDLKGKKLCFSTPNCRPNVQCFQKLLLLQLQLHEINWHMVLVVVRQRVTHSSIYVHAHRE